MAGTYLYGLENATHDFSKERSFGKNIFTNALPISLAMYLTNEMGLDPGWVRATNHNGKLSIAHGTKPLSEIIGAAPENAYWCFEEGFDGYNRYATRQVNNSDIVVKDLASGKETSAFEVKLTVVPTSNTANKTRDKQSCELVVRPPSIEQLCFSIAAGYGPDRRHDIGDIIASHLGYPMDYNWSNEQFMLEKLPVVTDAAEDIAINNIKNQRPFLLNAIWRTIGKSPALDKGAFDVFFWSDLAFLQFFTRSARTQINNNESAIGRPSRSTIWLVKALWDYSTQGKVTFKHAHSEITFGGQTDKAGAFTGAVSLEMVKCPFFIHPRIGRDQYLNIVKPEGIKMLSPERRLDGVLMSRYEYQCASYDSSQSY